MSDICSLGMCKLRQNTPLAYSGFLTCLARWIAKHDLLALWALKFTFREPQTARMEAEMEGNDPMSEARHAVGFFFCVKTFTGDKTVVILKANVPTGTRVQLEDVYIYIYYTHYNLLSLLLLLL